MVLTGGGSFIASANSTQINGVTKAGAAKATTDTGTGAYLYNYNNPGNNDDPTDTGTPDAGNYSSIIFYGVSLGNGTVINSSDGGYTGIAIGDSAHDCHGWPNHHGYEGGCEQPEDYERQSR